MLGAAFTAAALWLGCSDRTPASDTASSGDAAFEAARPAPAIDTSDDGGTCSQACSAAHPTGAPKNAAVDACWATSCRARCVDFTDLDAGDGGAPACGSVEVSTPTAACDACTVARCCEAWAACFSDPDCVALNACLQRCPTADE